MKINSDINVLGSIPDFELVSYFLNDEVGIKSLNNQLQSITSVSTPFSRQV